MKVKILHKILVSEFIYRTLEQQKGLKVSLLRPKNDTQTISEHIQNNFERVQKRTF